MILASKNKVNINLRANLGHGEGHLDRGEGQVAQGLEGQVAQGLGPSWVMVGKIRLRGGWVVLGPGD